MPATSPFFDSNVILYLVSTDARKADRAESLLQAEGIVSVQVLNEVAYVGRRKFDLAWTDIDDLLGVVRSCCEVVDLTVEVHDRGLAIAKQHGLNVCDAMIAASALASGCSTLYTEDMHAGLVIDRKLKLVNPFRA
jgi:predicted nucleic acid-binding protein